jgi:hypothetical protein
VSEVGPGVVLTQKNVEGKLNVNKLKLIKRMGYGRASFPLLRKPRSPRLVRRKELYEQSPSHRRQASITRLPESQNANCSFRSLLAPLELAPPARAVIGNNGLKEVQQGALVDGFVLLPFFVFV